MSTYTTSRFFSRTLAFIIAAISASRAWPAQSDFSGDITARGIGFFQTSAPNTNNSLFQGTLNLKDETEFSRNLKFTGHITYTADPTNTSAVEQNYIDAPELNLKARMRPWMIKLGSDIYNWGVTDGLNPVDLINTRQYYDPVHSVKMGAFGLDLNGAWSQFDFDIVYIPFVRRALLPGPNSRWLPRQQYNVSSGGQDFYILPSEFSYGFVNDPELNQARENNVASRQEWHVQGWDLDLALYEYYGISPVPLVQPVVTGNLINFSPYTVQVNTITLEVRDYRQFTGGASFVKTIESWQLKGEGAVTEPKGDATQFKGEYKTGILALEKNWSVSDNAVFITILQYASSHQTGDITNSLDSLSHFFDSNWMLGGQFAWRDKDRFTFFYSRDIIEQAWLTDLRFERVFSDNLTLGVAASLLGGPVASPLGDYAHNKNASVDLKYSF